MQRRWVTLRYIWMREYESWVCIYIYVFGGRCFSVWVTVPICKCIFVYQSQSLLTPNTVSSLTGLPEAELNERISIWQEWILDCALTDGWIRRDRASLQQDLHCWLRKCLRRGCCGKRGWVRAREWNLTALMEYHPFNYRKILMMSLYESINPQKNMARH